MKNYIQQKASQHFLSARNSLEFSKTKRDENRKKIRLKGYKMYHEFLEWGEPESAMITINANSKTTMDDLYKSLKEKYNLNEGEVEFIGCGVLRRRKPEVWW